MSVKIKKENPGGSSCSENNEKKIICQEDVVKEEIDIGPEIIQSSGAGASKYIWIKTEPEEDYEDFYRTIKSERPDSKDDDNSIHSLVKEEPTDLMQTENYTSNNDRPTFGYSGARLVTRKYLYNKMQEQNLLSFEEKLNYLESYLLTCENYTIHQKQDLKSKFSKLKSNFRHKWMEAGRNQQRFLKKNDSWLKKTFEIPRIEKRKSDRPSIAGLNERTKTEELDDDDDDVLTSQTTGNRDFKLHKRTLKVPADTQQQMTRLSALSLLIDADLSREQYEILRYNCKDFYPSYSLLKKEKKYCYPPKEAYTVTETLAQVNLQELLNLTVNRLLIYLKEIIQKLSPEERSTLQLISKWGCDRSQHAKFDQEMQNDITHLNIFQSSFVPVQLVCGTNTKKVIWQNTTPSSVRYCRPIRINFLEETEDIMQREIDHIENDIRSLEKTKLSLQNKSYFVQHIMTFTMVDAKICNAETQNMKCYICSAKSEEFNDLTIKKGVDVDALSFGLSILHIRIRLFESILHLSYKLPVKKYHLTTNADKAVVVERKKEIQENISLEMDLIVDRPINDGYASRRFFSNPELAAKITGVDFNLIYRIKVILEVILTTNTQKVHLDKFADYCIETAKLYVRLYPWHPMSATMHKILVHGAVVIEKALLPIGLLSRKVAEARNKYFDNFVDNCFLKFSRESFNRKVLKRLLLRSDPVISSLRLTLKIKRHFTKDTVEMLIPNLEPRIDDDDFCSDEEDAEDEYEE